MVALALAAAAACPAEAADLEIVPADQDRIVLDLLSDPHCPVLCGNPAPRCPDPPCPDSIACCDTFGAIVANQNARPVAQDFTYINGDVGINSNSILYPWMEDRFFGYYDQIQGAKGLGAGNHDADAGLDSTGGTFWVDPENHYAPLNWWEPLFACDSTTALEDCRRWYSVHIGSPPRVAWLVVSNNSDSKAGDETCYLWSNPPNDGLNHAASPQRQWLNAEIDALPASVEVVFVSGHRAYYGVENFACRPNILYSGHWSPADPETLRTGAVSFLRDLESIYDRKPNVERVFMISGDQHCFSETTPIRVNQPVVSDGVVYVVAGISGAWIGRGTVFPKLSKIPPDTFVHGFNDEWGSVRFEVATDEVSMIVHEAYSDSVLYQTAWPFDIATDASPAVSPPAGGEPALRVWPNPARPGPVTIDFRVPGVGPAKTAADVAVYGVDGKRVRQLFRGTWANGMGRLEWDGRDDDGHRVAAGHYFVRARVRGETVAAARVTISP